MAIIKVKTGFFGKSLADALRQARDGDTIELCAGDHSIPLINKSLTIVGASMQATRISGPLSVWKGCTVKCDQVTIFQTVASDDSYAVRVSAGATLQLVDSEIVSAGQGILSSGLLSLTRCQIKGMSGNAFFVSAGRTEMSECRISHCQEAAIRVIEKGTVQMARCYLRAINSNAVFVDQGGHVELTDCIMEEIRQAAICIDGEGSVAELRRIQVRNCEDVAVWIDNSATCNIEACAFSNTKGAAILASNGGAAAMKDSEVFDQPNFGIRATGGGKIAAQGGRIEDCAEIAASSYVDSELVLSGVKLTGAGDLVEVQTRGRAEIRDCTIEGSETVGVAVLGEGAHLSMHRTVIRGCEKGVLAAAVAHVDVYESDFSGFGAAVLSNAGATVKLVGCTVNGPGSIGLWAVGGGSVVFEQCRISQLAQSCIQVEEAGFRCVGMTSYFVSSSAPAAVVGLGACLELDACDFSEVSIGDVFAAEKGAQISHRGCRFAANAVIW